MKVLLLGATGLLGHNVLHQLTATGHEVVAVVRRGSSLHLKVPERMVVEGDISRPETVTRYATGCDAIVNCAGVTDMSLPGRQYYHDINTLLCSSILDAMNTHGIRRLVHASTVNTIGNGTAKQASDESAPIRSPFRESYYADSKLQGERILRQEASRHADWHVVVVNPGYMIGPMDVKPSSGRMLLMAYRHWLAVAPKGGKAFVDVRDVAAAMVNALERGTNGERYIAVNSTAQLTIKQLYRLQAQTMGYRQWVLELPNWLLRTAGMAGDMVRKMGVRTELSTNNVQQLMVHERYDNRRAVAELGLPETDIAVAIRDFHQWRETQQPKQ